MLANTWPRGGAVGSRSVTPGNPSGIFSEAVCIVVTYRGPKLGWLVREDKVTKKNQSIFLPLMTLVNESQKEL